MTIKSTQAMSAPARNFLRKPLNSLAVPLRREPCITSTLARTVAQSAQRWNRLFTSTHVARTSTITFSPIPAEGVVGQSGSRYKVLKTLQDKGPPWGAVYLAAGDDGAKVVLKEIPHGWGARNAVYVFAAGSRYVRLPVDVIPERHIFVFEYLDSHLLNVVQQDIPLAQVKRILRCTLQGIADLHARRILHNDIKPNNILVQRTIDTHSEKVLITDLEDAARLGPGGVLKGAKLGNFMWRSPEAHAEGPMELPSDIFAFGIVCIYAVTKCVILGQPDSESTEDSRAASAIFRQMSYFAGEDGTQGLYEYLGEDNGMRDVFDAVEGLFEDDDVVREPFVGWQLPVPGLDDDFKDLVGKLTNLDPRKRINAKEALAHIWFETI